MNSERKFAMGVSHLKFENHCSCHWAVQMENVPGYSSWFPENNKAVDVFSYLLNEFKKHKCGGICKKKLKKQYNIIAKIILKCSLD